MYRHYRVLLSGRPIANLRLCKDCRSAPAMAVISDAADELASLLDHLQTDDEQTQPAINGLDGSRDLLAVDWSRTADVAQRCADSLKSGTLAGVAYPLRNDETD